MNGNSCRFIASTRQKFSVPKSELDVRPFERSARGEFNEAGRMGNYSGQGTRSVRHAGQRRCARPCRSGLRPVYRTC